MSNDRIVYNSSGYSTQIMGPVSPEVLREPDPAHVCECGLVDPTECRSKVWCAFKPNAPAIPVGSEAPRACETTDCPTCGAKSLAIPTDDGSVRYQPADDDDVGCELSRIEADMLAIHDALVDRGQPGAINAESIIERIEGTGQERVIPATDLPPVCEGSYVWTDRDGDVRADLRPYPGPHIVASLGLATTEDAPQGVVRAGIYIDRDQAREIIAWLEEHTANAPSGEGARHD